MDISVTPEGSLEILSREEVERLSSRGQSGLQEIFRKCALAVLNTGGTEDDVRSVMRKYADFDVSIIELDRGVRLDLRNAPDSAFVDGQMIRGVRELLFAVLRDIVYIGSELAPEGRLRVDSPSAITETVFHILRNARALRTQTDPNLVVCWGGHSISREEYEYTKDVGYELGLRGLNVCTGCGAGAMKGPMKGATIGHSKQRIRAGRYIGISEPGIIAAESPNPIVNELVIMPDIEKRLEAFVRVGHGIVVFPGGAGTAEEILYLLGILLHPDNAAQPMPIVFAGPESSRSYFDMIERLLLATLGETACRQYRVVIGEPARVAQIMVQGIEEVRAYRHAREEAYFFNWNLVIDAQFQQPFEVTHESMARLDLSVQQPPHQLAAQLRRAFSGVVAGNVREDGIRRVEQFGPFELRGDPSVAQALDEVLSRFVAESRMKLAGSAYTPCFRIVA
jgi:predicted Rossmann-fold nucleotide-binding protein